MTFNNLCELYENACLDYEVSVLTEGADSEEAKTAEAKKTGLGKKVFAAVGAAFQKLWEMIKRLLTFIKSRFVREKIKLANDVQLVPVKEYKKLLANRIEYITNGLKIQTISDDGVKLQTTPVKAGSIVDKTAYVEILEKLEKIAKRYTSLKIEAENLVKKNSEYTNTRQGIHEYNKSVHAADNYRALERYLNKFVRLIKTDIQTISSNAVPEDVAPVNDKKEKADANNESAMFGGLTRNELRAKLLIEAADALAADDNATNTDALGDNGDGEVTPTCLDCDKEEADIDDDYLTSVSGADDENSDPEMDEIEDLLDDEKDAIDILTDREGTETVDAQEPTLESILGLNF